MRSAVRSLRKRRFSYVPLVEVQVHQDRLIHNLNRFLTTYPKHAIAPVLKSNAYGHGLAEVAGILDQVRRSTPGRLPFLVVDSYHEAMILRNEGITTPILLIGFSAIHNIAQCRLRDVAFTITSLEMLECLAEAAKKSGNGITIHLKIDTGMHRQGILENELQRALEIIDTCHLLRLEGICSHLADSEPEQSAQNAAQIAAWNSIVDTVGNRHGLRFTHISATHGAWHSTSVKANVIRLGLGLYGISAAPARDVALALMPALSLSTVITSTKTVPKGAAVGYGGTFAALREMRIATLPLGYNEGVDRRLSGRGFVQINAGTGKLFKCPILGRVSMNITTIDVSGVPTSELRIGTPVIIISEDPVAPNSVAAIAETCGTIAYEILVHISPSLSRKVV